MIKIGYVDQRVNCGCCGVEILPEAGFGQWCIKVNGIAVCDDCVYSLVQDDDNDNDEDEWKDWPSDPRDEKDEWNVPICANQIENGLDYSNCIYRGEVKEMGHRLIK